MTLKHLQQPPADIPKTAEHTAFAGFDQSRYGLNDISFYQFLLDTSPTHLAAQDDTDTATALQLYVKVIGHGGENWYQLEGPKASEALLAQRSAEQDEAQRQGSDEQEHVQPESSPQHAGPPAAITQPDSRLPLFQVTWGSNWVGANTTGTRDEVAILDFRSEPLVAQNMECLSSAEGGGGACGDFDAQYTTDLALNCVWQKDAADYACHSLSTQNMGWGTRSSESDFYFMSGTDAYKPAAHQPANLESFLQTLNAASEPGQRATIADLGEVQVIYTVREPGRALYLLAARGRGQSLDARFFLGEQPFNDRPTGVVEMKPAVASALPTLGFAELDFERQRDAHPEPVVANREGGAPLSFQLRKLRETSGFTVLAVTVEEGKNAHSLYWIGIDERQQPTIADALLVATDAHPYEQCDKFRQERSAASARITPGVAFHAFLDVEPARLEDESGAPAEDDDDTSPKLTCTERLAWDRAKGFVIGEVEKCKELPPRTITITDAGEIVAKPLAAPATPAANPAPK